jgi:alpha-ribazole phosphatase
MNDSEGTTVWLIRHGSTDGGTGRCCGRYDARLSTQGVQQANAIAKRLGREPISHVYSSGLSRALDTARAIVEPHGLPIHTVNDLAEMNFGDLDGLTFSEIQERYAGIFESWVTRPTVTRFPNGETLAQMRERVLGAFELILSRHSKETIVIVTHAGVIRLVLAAELSMPDDQIFRLAQDYGAINRIKYFDHGPVVELING